MIIIFKQRLVLAGNSQNRFCVNKDIHNYNTRNASLLHKKCNRTNYIKHTLANKGIDVWNNIPL